MGKVYQEAGSTFESDGVIYDLNKIFKAVANEPVQDIAVDKLSWILTPHSSPDKERVDHADLSAPILVTKYGAKELVVDGEHRLRKAIQEDVKTLPYRRVSSKVIKDAELSKATESIAVRKPIYSDW